MIGSHDSYTFLPAVDSKMELISDFWRCQNKNITDQYKAGVRFFDIRVAEEKVGTKIYWRVCHGIVDVQQRFVSIEIILKMFTKTYPGSSIRIMLEKGPQEFFKKEIARLAPVYSVLKFASIKETSEVIWTAPDAPMWQDYSFQQWFTDKNFIENVKHNVKSSIKEWARDHNPKLTQEMIDDPSVNYFMNYVCF